MEGDVRGRCPNNSQSIDQELGREGRQVWRHSCPRCGLQAPCLLQKPEGSGTERAPRVLRSTAYTEDQHGLNRVATSTPASSALLPGLEDLLPGSSVVASTEKWVGHLDVIPGSM